MNILETEGIITTMCLPQTRNLQPDFFDQDFRDSTDKLENWCTALREVEEARAISPRSERYEALKFDFYDPDDGNSTKKKKQNGASAPKSKRNSKTDVASNGPSQSSSDSHPAPQNGRRSDGKRKVNGRDLNNNKGN